MFAFGYALVPLYNALCIVTGLNGKTATIATKLKDQPAVDLSRSVSVELVGTVNSRLPWDFAPVTPSLSVHPGAVQKVEFRARNNLPTPVVGRAVPSVAPGTAAKYFKKIECFCFDLQTLAGHEEKRMTVRFYIDPELPKSVTTVTLSYTFFDAQRT
jgi:cytochrome c oxidase assembly protein subunit 11